MRTDSRLIQAIIRTSPVSCCCAIAGMSPSGSNLISSSARSIGSVTEPPCRPECAAGANPCRPLNPALGWRRSEKQERIALAPSGQGRAVSDLILETRGLTKEFRGFVAVQGVNLKVRRGTIHALIGPNGAGKTTCFNLLTHFLTPTTGRIFFNERDITGLRPSAIARMGMVRSFQISATFPHLTVLEHNLSVVSTLSDHITVLARGQILAEGDYATVSKHPEVIQAYLGAGHA